MRKELKPCPFCGEKAAIFVEYYHPDIACCIVNCTNCNPSSADENKAVINWNNRPIEDALQNRISALEAENNRLREALEEIAEFANDEYGKRIPAPSCVEFMTIKLRAEKALKGAGE